MRQQSAQHTCGAMALCNALEALSEKRLEETKAAKLCDTTAIWGTQPAGIKRALKRLRMTYVEHKTKDGPTAYWFLYGALSTGNPVVLLVDDEEHWITAIGILGNRVVIADSADPGTVAVITPAQLMARWGASHEFYGLVVGPKP